jgi:hypothetical protein
MKQSALLGIVLGGIVMLPASLYSDTIDVLSQTYTIQGSAPETLLDSFGFPINFPFSFTSPTPIFLNDLLPPGHPPLATQGSLDTVPNYAIGSVTPSALSLGVQNASAINASISAQMLFRPNENTILNVEIQGETPAAGLKFWRVVLTDVTTSTTLLDDSFHFFGSIMGSNHDFFHIPLDASDTYLLRDETVGQEGDFAAAQVFASVPETGSTKLLLGMSLLALVGCGAARRPRQSRD